MKMICSLSEACLYLHELDFAFLRGIITYISTALTRANMELLQYGYGVQATLR